MSEDDTRESDLAAEDECTVDSEDEGAEDWSPFDEIQDSYQPGPIKKVTAADGMPTNHAPVPEESDIPVLSKETLVCMEDTSSFAVRNVFGDVIASFDAQTVERSPGGAYRVKWAVAIEALKLELTRVRQHHAEQAKRFPAEQLEPIDVLTDQELAMKIMFDMAHARGSSIACNSVYVEVEPVRPRCRFYVQQLTQFDLNAQHRMMIRACSARRTTEGAMMTLRDRAVWDCTMRVPAFDAGGIERFDREKTEQGRSRRSLPMFEGAGIFSGGQDG